MPAPPQNRVEARLTLALPHHPACGSAPGGSLNIAARSSYDPLAANQDGSVDLYFGPDAPADSQSNWIKTLPGRGWFAWFRFYAPTEPFFDKNWEMPDFEKINPDEPRHIH